MGQVNKQAWKNMREVSIIGIGLHKFGRWPDKGPGDLGRVAIQEALDDAGVEFGDIQAGWCGRVNNITGTGPSLFGEIGQPGILIDNVERPVPVHLPRFVWRRGRSAPASMMWSSARGWKRCSGDW